MKQLTQYYFVTISLLLLVGSSSYANSPDTLTSLSELKNLSVYIDSLGTLNRPSNIDKQKPLTFEEIKTYNPRHTYWFHFSLINEKDSRQVYQLTTSVYDSLTLYTIQAGDTTIEHRGLLIKYTTQDKVAFRNFDGDKYSFRSTLAPYSTKHFFLKIKNKIRFESEFEKIKVGRIPATNFRDIWFLLFHAFLFSIIFFIATFTFIQYLQNRDAAYGWYMIYLFFTFFYFWWKFEKGNSLVNILFTEFPNWYYYVEIPMTISIYISYIFFLIHFINAKKEVPTFYRLLKTVSLLLLFYLVFDRILLLVWGFTTSWEIYFSIRILFILFGLYAFLIVLRSKAELAVYLLSGGIIILLGSGITGYLSKTMTQHYVGAWDIPLLPVQIATILEIFCFSIGLGYKSHLAEKEKVLIAQSLVLERKEKENQQQRQEQLTHWFTQISHEIRTPLTVISGINNTIKGHTAATSLIGRNCQQLLNLVQQILSFQKLEANKLEIHWIKGDVMQYLCYLGQSFDYLAMAKQQLLSIYCEPVQYEMDFDKEKLQHILNNLLSNALKHSPEKATIQLKATILKKGKEDLLQIQIKDTGPGIPPSFQQKIFEPYVQLPNTPSGTGIGLALVKEYVHLLGGQITLKSELGEGSCFTLCFPVRTHLETELKELLEVNEHPLCSNYIPLDAPSYAENKPIVLLIEDHLDIIRYLQYMLQDQFTLLSATNGKEGLQKAKELKPDIIIADIMMPLMDGYELCQQLKQHNTTQSIPIIFLTAKATTEDRIKALQLGATAFLTKPFNEQELLLHIHQSLQKRSTKNALPDFIELPSTQAPLEREAIQFLQMVHQIMEDNLSKEHFKVKELSSSLNTNHTSLNEKLKRLTGKTTGKYIRQYRLSTAKDLLEKTDLPLKEIAWKVGIPEVSNFSTMFKKAYGRSPRKWRNG